MTTGSRKVFPKSKKQQIATKKTEQLNTVFVSSAMIKNDKMVREKRKMLLKKYCWERQATKYLFRWPFYIPTCRVDKFNGAKENHECRYVYVLLRMCRTGVEREKLRRRSVVVVMEMLLMMMRDAACWSNMWNGQSNMRYNFSLDSSFYELNSLFSVIYLSLFILVLKMVRLVPTLVQ